VFNLSSVLGLILTVALLCSGAHVAIANVVRPSPDFAWMGAGGKTENFREFREQPVVLLIAPDPRSWAFRRQIGHLQRVYQRLAATGAICVAAFTREPGIIRSNIPFVLAQDGPQVAGLFGAGSGFNIAVIGKDGNIDVLTDRVLTGQRILDVINNSYAVQESLRRN
jgi:hypothetical protein